MISPPIVARIRNCKTIADNIPSTHAPDDSNEGSSHLSDTLGMESKSMLYRLCVMASTSHYCHQYIYTYEYYSSSFKSSAEGDAYLEAALLVACGFAIEDVKSAMVKLAKEGKLARYGRTSPKQFRYYNGAWRMCMPALGMNLP